MIKQEKLNIIHSNDKIEIIIKLKLKEELAKLMKH